LKRKRLKGKAQAAKDKIEKSVKLASAQLFLRQKIHVGDGDPDFTSPLTCNSSFKSVGSID
jgi:hypothetical protein